MTGDTQSLPIGERVSLPGHFATQVVLEEVRPLPGAYECLVRLPDGRLEEVVISQEWASSDHAVERSG